MNKKIYIAIIGFITLLSCDTEDTLTCLKTSGDIITREYDLATFDSIIVFERLQLIVKEGPITTITLETGENLLEDFEVSVVDNTLQVRNNGACNLVRDYDVSKVYVTHPNLKQIRNSSGLTVKGDGVISWPDLRLISDDLIEEDFYHKDGDFELTLASPNVLIQCNGLSNYFLSGSVTNLDIRLLEGDSRLPLDDLEVQHVTIFHRGTNDVFLSPQQSITGELRSTGNLVLNNVPPVFEVETFFTGEVIID